MKIADAKTHEIRGTHNSNVSSGITPESQLAALRSELVLKSAIYSDSHPDIKALKLRIAALEKSLGTANGKPTETIEVNVDALERQRDSIKENLESISKKLAAARLGENLERGQHSERLSVIEQPTFPLKSERPNRPKILAAVFAIALAAGGGLVFLLEMLDGTIRRNADLAKLIDSQLIVSIPFITTKADLYRQKVRRIVVAVGCSVGVVLAGVVAAIYLLPKFGLL
jgi:capsular polysaccharide biosynthesis protein